MVVFHRDIIHPVQDCVNNGGNDTDRSSPLLIIFIVVVFNLPSVHLHEVILLLGGLSPGVTRKGNGVVPWSSNNSQFSFLSWWWRIDVTMVVFDIIQ